MPQFDIQGDAEFFENIEEIDINGDIARFSFVTAEKGDEHSVIITPVHPKDLETFDGLLFQIDINEEEDVVVLKQIQMFFWPWDDDEEFADANSPDEDA